MSDLISSFARMADGPIGFGFQGTARTGRESGIPRVHQLQRPSLASLVLTILGVLLGASVAVMSSAAQTTSAGVSGRVTDSTGGVIVEAQVEIRNVETGVSTKTKTNGDGLYNIPSLKPGQYLISASKAGFKTVTVTQLELNVQDNVVRNFQLQVGSISETVTIDGSGLNMNTTDATVGTVIDHTYVENMPLNGRSFQDLVLLTPGIVTNSPQQPGSLGSNGEFSVNGQRTESNVYTVDGVSANVGAASGFGMEGPAASGSLPAATASGTTHALVSVDALQEFRVQSSTYSAEYGRNPGGQFAFETKSGTNRWHGTGYDYLRNGYFDAQDWFNDYFRLPQPAIRQNDFGATFGGPLTLPGLYNGKDKTFFFVSYEGLRLTAPQPASVNFVPDAALRSTAAPAVQQVLNAWPLQSPNGVDDSANGVAQYIATWSNPSSLNSTSVRFDHALSDKVKLFFRFGNTTSSSAIRGNPSAEISPTLNQISAYTTRTYTIGANSVFSNRLSDEFRLNYSSNETTNSDVIDGLGGSKPVDLLHLSGLSAGALADFFLGIGPYFLDLNQQQSSGTQRQWNLVDALNLSLGRHQLKFGVDYRRLTPFATPPAPQVSYSFFDIPSIQTNPDQGLFVQTFAAAHPLYTNFSAFAQDDWRVSGRLSLSLGLRWEVNPAPGVTRGLKPYTIRGSSPDTLVLAPEGTPLWQTAWYNFAPRVGIAYVLGDVPGRETVVRGGGGVFFDTGQQLGSLGFTGPGFKAFAFPSGPFPIDVPPLVPPIVNPPATRSFTAYAFPAHLQLPYTVQWNASVEQALGKSQALTFSYVGSHGTRLLELDSINTPNSTQFFDAAFIKNGLTSDYGALQVQFQRRLSRGLTALGSYTWSHCIDYGSQNFDFGYRRGNCDFDVRHNLSTAFSFDMPNVGHSGFLSAVLHHWGLDDRFTARTAFPVVLAGNQLQQPDGQFYRAGVNLVSDQPIYIYGAACSAVYAADFQSTLPCPGGRALNPNAFVSVNSGFGNAPRNFARGFGAWQMNVAIRRDFPIHESLRVQFRAEAFNVFNHPNFGMVNPNVGQNTFGQATASLASSLGILNPLYQTGGPRSMQFGLKFLF